ncbi:hypothetical protein CANARDRAFT_22658 [[Candida] arabinofermentans NRRL YB-2248]|uniref:Uncharacterized protein n=1 Tax=[Candida] arabinofermentans NRRL YB-2248 TaxID=983967 RepID=A0A1E4T2B8_9ASCO|nr:hypothetical protein CANARDRAFT_22658 [[Candida] arabinofermentans NRRL YB-2248]
MGQEFDPESPFEVIEDDLDSSNSKSTLQFLIFYLHPYKSPSETVLELENIYKYLNVELKPYLTHYPWLKAPVEFKLFKYNDDSKTRRFSKDYSFIYGKLKYGNENSDTELLSSILYKFTSRDENMFIRLFEENVESIILDCYPYIDQSTSSINIDQNTVKNRIWINNLMIKYIPEEYYTGKNLTLIQALKFMENSSYKMATPIGLNEYYKENIVDQYPEKVLRQIHVYQVKVSEKLATLIMDNPLYMATAALCSSPDAVSLSDGGINQMVATSNSRKIRLSSDYSFDLNESKLVTIHLRLPVIAYLELLDGDEDISLEQQHERELEWGRKLSFDLEQYVYYTENEVNYNPNTSFSKERLDEYNLKINQDELQVELLRYLIIDKKMKPDPLEKLLNINENEKTNLKDPFDALPENLNFMKDKLFEEYKDKSNMSDFEYYSDDYNNDSEYDSDTQGDHLRSFLDKQNGNGNENEPTEDEFFEFFCKDALGLSDEQIESYRAEKNDGDNEQDIKDLSRLLANIGKEG